MLKTTKLIKIWVTGLSLGLLGGAIAACTPQASTPEVAPTPEVSETAPAADRAAYSEVPLPQDALLVGDDPQQIALTVFGTSDPGEGNFKEEVVLVEQTTTQALVTLTQTGLPDDSVEGMRYRLEFVPEGSQWRLDWAGRQVRCRPNRGSQDWGTELCG